MVRIVLCAEGNTDVDAVRRFIDRAILAAGLARLGDEEGLERARKHTGLAANEPFVRWSTLKDRPMPKLRLLGFEPGKKTSHDAIAVRKVLAICYLELARVEFAVVLQRDADNQTVDRWQSIQEAAADFRPHVRVIVLGYAVPSIEAWWLHGFVPENPAEAQRLARVNAELRHNVVVNPHQIHRDKLKDALAVLAPDPERRARLLEAPLPRLEELGKASGLAEFLKSVKSDLAPFVDGGAG